MFKSFVLAALCAEASAISLTHHHHHPRGQMMVMDDPTCTTSQETGHCLLTHYKDEGKIDGSKINYVVPNFGADHDITDGLKFSEEAETDLDHKWVIPQHVLDGKPAPAGPPKDYFVPNFGVDEDIKGAHENLAVVEKELGHQLVIPKSSAIRENEDVPPFHKGPQALDGDVRTSLANTMDAEKSLDHKWDIVWN
jgi:hypothetical protein